ncbi:Protein PHYLLO, chloroplastic [Morella rubra]|uniref:Protein PHYLLO, chloroplastic n=1 Tax=Morella rubra TaxID=262757 RepID=A0A6A1V3G6_9ROSI|nr:Protein PHYLLO, chloroplastic [Morella rubra]
MAYGFVDINFHKVSSCMMHEAGSSYFFIPQIELDEHEGFSILAATLAWSDSSFCSFEDAVCSFELSLKQNKKGKCPARAKASSHSWPTKDICGSKSIRSTLRKLNLVEDKTVTMVPEV